MYEVSVRTQFSAAHRLADYAGNCARWHGHNWDVQATLGATELNELGLSVDFREAKKAVGSVLERLDHTDLNALAEFAGCNPSCEVIARFIYRELARHFAGSSVRVLRVQVCETPNAGVVYYE
jgi:6-pyruvoyltetrahydropterin/6-carboxytetrahydropterin synthase